MNAVGGGIIIPPLFSCPASGLTQKEDVCEKCTQHHESAIAKSLI
jgi:hypothetical protein